MVKDSNCGYEHLPCSCLSTGNYARTLSVYCGIATGDIIYALLPQKSPNFSEHFGILS